MHYIEWLQATAKDSKKNQQVLINARIAQLVEHDLAKVGVASSNLVSRSKFNTVTVSALV